MATKREQEEKIKELRAELKAHKRVFKEELEYKAIDFIKDGNDYLKIIIAYDFDMKQGRIVSVEKIADTKHMAIYKAKELISKKFLLDLNWDEER